MALTSFLVCAGVGARARSRFLSVRGGIPMQKCLTRLQQPTDGDRATAQPIEQPTCSQKHTYRASAWSTVRPENHDNALRARAGSRASAAPSGQRIRLATAVAGPTIIRWGAAQSFSLGKGFFLARG